MVESVTLEPIVEVPDQIPSSIRPWDFRSSLAPTERRLAFKRFQHYIGQGPGRTLSETSHFFRVSLPVISRSAKKYHWITRAAAYDEFKALYDAEQAREKRHQEHLQKLESFRNRSEKVGEAMIAASAQLLQQANATIQEMKAQGETLDRKLLASALQASARVAESGRLLMAQSLGVDALISNIDGADGESDDYS